MDRQVCRTIPIDTDSAWARGVAGGVKVGAKHVCIVCCPGFTPGLVYETIAFNRDGWQVLANDRGEADTPSRLGADFVPYHDDQESCDEMACAIGARLSINEVLKVFDGHPLFGALSQQLARGRRDLDSVISKLAKPADPNRVIILPLGLNAQDEQIDRVMVGGKTLAYLVGGGDEGRFTIHFFSLDVGYDLPVGGDYVQACDIVRKMIRDSAMLAGRSVEAWAQMQPELDDPVKSSNPRLRLAPVLEEAWT